MSKENEEDKEQEEPKEQKDKKESSFESMEQDLKKQYGWHEGETQVSSDISKAEKQGRVDSEEHGDISRKIERRTKRFAEKPSYPEIDLNLDKLSSRLNPRLFGKVCQLQGILNVLYNIYSEMVKHDLDLRVQMGLDGKHVIEWTLDAYNVSKRAKQRQEAFEELMESLRKKQEKTGKNSKDNGEGDTGDADQYR